MDSVPDKTDVRVTNKRTRWQIMKAIKLGRQKALSAARNGEGKKDERWDTLPRILLIYSGGKGSHMAGLVF